MDGSLGSCLELLTASKSIWCFGTPQGDVSVERAIRTELPEKATLSASSRAWSRLMICPIVRFVFTVTLTVALIPTASLAAQSVIPGLDAAGMDTAVRPGNDFYGYANGNWDRHTQIPPDKSSYGAFNIAADRAEN